MFKLLRVVIGGAVALVLLLVVGVFAAVWYVDSLAQRGIQSGATHALGVQTTVRTVDIGLFRGTVQIEGLQITNPSGFQSPTFLKLENGRTVVALRSLRQDVIQIPELRFQDLDVVLERRGGNANYQVILDNLERFRGPAHPSPQTTPGDEKRVIIHELIIRNVTVHADLLGGEGVLREAAGQIGRITVPIDEIRLTDVGRTGEGVAGSGVTMGELAGLVVEALLAAAVEKGGDLLPADVVSDLRGKLASLGGLQDIGVEISGQVQEIGKTLERIRAPEDVGEAIRRGTEEVDRLRDLLPGGKK
jgi:hypothetical protein